MNWISWQNPLSAAQAGRARPGWLLALLCAAVFAAGCATSKIDWNSRVGNYTFDQTVLEQGPPDKQAKLEDGTVVAEWLNWRGRGGGVRVAGGFGMGYGMGYYGGPSSVLVLNDPPSSDRFLRLTFGPDGKLSAWRTVYR